MQVENLALQQAAWFLFSFVNLFCCFVCFVLLICFVVLFVICCLVQSLQLLFRKWGRIPPPTQVKWYETLVSHILDTLAPLLGPAEAR